MIRLDILSDPICPWCLIGWTNLARALESRPDHPFAIEWHPFQLNPDMPREGVDRKEYLEAKFGGPEGAAKVYGRIAEHARAAGIEIDFDRIARTPNTLDAHRVIHWAGLEGRQTPVKVALMRAYFQEGRDIGDHEVLLDIAADRGLDREMIARLLDSDADLEDIRARDAHARERGVSGVPTFVIANQHVVQGAQPTDLWERVIDDIAAQVDRQRDAAE
ncbi:thioredoxin domain-containing protein [Rhodobacterales bacterium HKCCE3408]|nr:thioredoxin domain-containing protein [Rhodobacterales bacterium HKCCE3408]